MKLILFAIAIFALLTQPWIRSPDNPKVATLVVAPKEIQTGAIMAPDTIGLQLASAADTANTAVLHQDPGRAGINGVIAFYHGTSAIGKEVYAGPSDPKHTV